MNGAFASDKCQEKMLNGYNLYSQAFTVSDIYQGLDIEGDINGHQAETIVSYFIESLECLSDHKSQKALQLKGTCRNIEVGNFLSKSCYISSKIGYFIITFNMMEGAHLIYNRYD